MGHGAGLPGKCAKGQVITAADVIALYLNPPQHAVVFSLGEKTAIQALDRRDPVLPMSPGRSERHGFEYVRKGTLSLYAALHTKTGAVIGQTATRHISEEFVAFLGAVVAGQPRGQQIHIILDNLSTHKTKRVQEFLAAHPRVQLHFTPTYSSWLNQVALWFSKIERDLINRRRLPLDQGPPSQADDLHPQAQRHRQTNQMEVRRSAAAHSLYSCGCFSWYEQLVGFENKQEVRPGELWAYERVQENKQCEGDGRARHPWNNLTYTGRFGKKSAPPV